MDTAKLDAALADIVTKVSDLADKHGPDAVALAAKVYQLSYASKILWPIVAIALCAVSALLLSRFVKAAFAADKADEDDKLVSCVVGAIGSGIGTLVMGIASMVGIFDHLVNPLVWAAAFDPRVAIAAKILSKL